MGAAAAVHAVDHGFGGHAGTVWRRACRGRNRPGASAAGPSGSDHPAHERPGPRGHVLHARQHGRRRRGRGARPLRRERRPRDRGPVPRRGVGHLRRATTGRRWPPSGPTWRCVGRGAGPGHGRPARTPCATPASARAGGPGPSPTRRTSFRPGTTLLAGAGGPDGPARGGDRLATWEPWVPDGRL